MNLEELERLAREATPGPWRAYSYSTTEHVVPEVWGKWGGELSDHIARKEDAAFIAACSPETVLRLVSIAKAAQAYMEWSDPVICTDPELRVIRAALRAALIPPGCKPT